MTSADQAGSIFCLRCGQPLPSVAAFCSRCGYPVVKPEEPLPVVSAPAPPRGEADPPLLSTVADSREATVQPELPHAGEASPTSKPKVRLSWVALAGGALVGVLVAISGAWVVVQAASKPLPTAGATVHLGVDQLPAQILGRTRQDLEIKDLYPSDSGRLRDIAGATVQQFIRAYGGEGIVISYGAWARRELALSAVNGDLNLPLVIPLAEIERAEAVPAGRYLAVSGTETAACAYAPADSQQLGVRSAEEVVSSVLGSEPAGGTLVCVRSDEKRNFSVQLKGEGVSSSSPRAAASELASAVDQVWAELVGE